MIDYLEHYGVKGMKWGVRKSVSRRDRKEVNRLYKGLKRSTGASEIVTAASLSKLSREDYELASKLLDRGQLYMKAELKKNYMDKSVDVYLGESASPTVRAKLEAGNNFSYRFLNDDDMKRYSEFAKYYQSRHK